MPDNGAETTEGEKQRDSGPPGGEATLAKGAAMEPTAYLRHGAWLPLELTVLRCALCLDGEARSLPCWFVVCQQPTVPYIIV